MKINSPFADDFPFFKEFEETEHELPEKANRWSVNRLEMKPFY